MQLYKQLLLLQKESLKKKIQACTTTGFDPFTSVTQTIQLYYDLHLLATFEDKFVFKKLDGPVICGSLFPLLCLKFSLTAVQMTTNL